MAKVVAGCGIRGSELIKRIGKVSVGPEQMSLNQFAQGLRRLEVL